MDGWLPYLGLALSLVGPALLVLAVRYGIAPKPVLRRRLFSAAGLWILTGLVMLVLLAQHRSFDSIGLGPISLANVLWGLAGGGAGILAFPLCMIILRAFRVSTVPAQDTNGLMGLPLWARILILITAAVTEEVLYRGYPVSTLQSLGGPFTLAILLPLAVFVIVHLPAWGWSHLVFVSAAGGLLTLLFVLEGSLWSNIIAHAVIDAVPLLILPGLAGRAGARGFPAR